LAACEDQGVLAGTPILVEASQGKDRAGVRRDAEGFLWISLWRDAEPERVAGTRLEGVEPAQIREHGWSAVGGVLPDDARSVEVRGDDGAWRRAEVGQGAWVVFVAYDLEALGLPPMLFAGKDGALISRVSPGTVTAARRLDQSEAELLARGLSGLGGECPACGAVDWRAIAPESGPGERIFCGVCGHSDGAAHMFYGVDG
jgi:hypothetical protein